MDVLSADLAAVRSRSPMPHGAGSDASTSTPSSLPHPMLVPLEPTRSLSPSRAPTSAEIDAVIAAAIANAPPMMPPQVYDADAMRSKTPLMTNLLPSAVGADGRVNLFVGNLPYRVRWQDLKDLFRKAGTVLRADVSLGQDNRSRGYGTVLMGSREDAARAIDRYNGFTWQTRTLEVRPDRLPPEYEAQQHYPHHVNPQPHPGVQGHPHPLSHQLGLALPPNMGGSLPPFIAGSQTHPYPHPHPQQQAWHGPGAAAGPGVGGMAGAGPAGVNGQGRGGGDIPPLQHPFPQQAIQAGQGVAGSQAGLLFGANTGTGPGAGSGGSRVAGAGAPRQGHAQSFGSFGAPSMGMGGQVHPGQMAGLTPHLTGTSSIAGTSAPGRGGERERDSNSPFPVAASPLAGALTGTGTETLPSGSVPNALPIPTGPEGRRDSTQSKSASPFISHAVPPAGIAPGAGMGNGVPEGARRDAHSHSKSFSTSSALYATQSRTSGNSGHSGHSDPHSPASNATPPVAHRDAPSGTASTSMPRSHSHSHSASTSSRAAPPGNLGPLPPNYFAALAGATNGAGGNNSSVGMGNTNGAAAGAGAGVGHGNGHGRSHYAGTSAAPHFPVPIEGMAHQGVGLGPPENLHDRVVFVSNMPLNMQWQDLKDMLRPAGMIMRVDVAQDDNRRPRGYGTALFASEGDATRAVQMFNGCEVGGHRLRIHLERDANVPVSQPESSASSSGADDRSEAGDNGQNLSTGSKSKAGGASPARSKVPWGINTTLAQTPIRSTKIASSPNGTPYAQLPHSPTLYAGGPTPGPSFRSNAPPGPLSIPPFGIDPNTPTHASHSAHVSHNPLSPQMRGLPPMTPSMPGFVFNGYPDTPGPHFFGLGHAAQQGFGGFGMGMQMGMGGMGMGMGMVPMGMMTPGPVIAPAPFSPGLPMSPMHPHTPNPFLNTAPGAPIDRILAQAQLQSQAGQSGNGNINGRRSASGGGGMNGIGSGNLTPARPHEGVRGSAALGTPTTTVFAGRMASKDDDIAAETPGPIRAQANGSAGYFPYVPRTETGDATPSRMRKAGAQGQGQGNSGGGVDAIDERDERDEGENGDEGTTGLEALTEEMHIEGRRAEDREGEEMKGRQSLDGTRPRAISTGERRASFGDKR